MGGIAMWIARDRNGSLWIYKHKPIKNKFGSWVNSVEYKSHIFIPIRIWKNAFPEVKWEDEEPRELILK